MGFCKHSDEVLDLILTWNVLEGFQCMTSGMKTKQKFISIVVN